jgi:hypothetical protein
MLQAFNLLQSFIFYLMKSRDSHSFAKRVSLVLIFSDLILRKERGFGHSRLQPHTIIDFILDVYPCSLPCTLGSPTGVSFKSFTSLQKYMPTLQNAALTELQITSDHPQKAQLLK